MSNGEEQSGSGIYASDTYPYVAYLTEDGSQGFAAAGSEILGADDDTKERMLLVGTAVEEKPDMSEAKAPAAAAADDEAEEEKPSSSRARSRKD